MQGSELFELRCARVADPAALSFADVDKLLTELKSDNKDCVILFRSALLQLLLHRSLSIACADAPVRYHWRTGEKYADSPLSMRISRLGLTVQRQYDGGEAGSLLLINARPTSLVPMAHNLLCSMPEHFAIGGERAAQYWPLRQLCVSDFKGRRQCSEGTAPRECSVCAAVVPVEALLKCDQCQCVCCARCCRNSPLNIFRGDLRLSRQYCDSEMGEWPAVDDKGRIFAWFCWTGYNAMPDYLKLCMDSFAHQAARDFCVRLVGPNDVHTLLDDVHPAYDALSLVHRADYLRCELMHRYGGLWADVDTICISALERPLRALRKCSAVLPDSGLLHEAGMNVGLFRRRSHFTSCWQQGVRARLDAGLLQLLDFRREFPSSLTEDALGWNELLRDLIFPLVCGHQRQRKGLLDVGTALQAYLWLPTREQGFDPLRVKEAAHVNTEAGVPRSADLYGLDVVVLTNNQYSGSVKAMPRNAFLRSDNQLAEMIRRANGWSLDDCLAGKVVSAVKR